MKRFIIGSEATISGPHGCSSETLIQGTTMVWTRRLICVGKAQFGTLVEERDKNVKSHSMPLALFAFFRTNR